MLNSNDTVIAGLKGGFSYSTAIVSGSSPHVTSGSYRLPKLTIRVPEGEEYFYKGEIHNLKKIVIDGEGIQKILGSVTRDKVTSDVSAEDFIVEVNSAELHVRGDTFDAVKTEPLYVAYGATLVVLSPSDIGKKFENPIKGSGRVDFRFGAEIDSSSDVSSFELRVTGSTDLGGEKDWTFSGLVSSDPNAVVENSGYGVSRALIVNVSEGKEFVFDGKLGIDLPFKK